MIDDAKRLLKDILQLGDRIDNFTADTPLLGSIAELDSMAVVSILTAFEEQYDVVVEDDEISADVFETVGALAEFMRSKTA